MAQGLCCSYMIGDAENKSLSELLRGIVDSGIVIVRNQRFVCRFVKFQKDGYAKIWVMPRYGEVDSVQWFEVQPHWTFHLLNYFEDDNEQENKL
ncbi:hypothetical protein Q3G72_033340 [Acer saccharum]|nr:hypothetical protein Q3G72_033340 [Acer saccharum]